MALTDNGNGMYMPVAPAYGYGGGNGLFGGDGAWWIIILLLCGWGNGFGGFGGGMMWPMMMGGMGGFGMDYLYPWLNNSQHISDGFRDQQLQTSIGTLQNSVTSGFGDVQLGIAGVNQNICQTGNGITAAINASTMADMNRSFALQSQLAQCCCDNKAATADLKYTVATENCADRTAAYQNTRDIIDSQTRGTQAILDKLCALELSSAKREAADLRTQLNMAQLAASQTAQTAELRQSGATQLNQLVTELRSCPIPSYSVYGNQPVFTCAGPTTGNSCGCGGTF